MYFFQNIFFEEKTRFLHKSAPVNMRKNGYNYIGHHGQKMPPYSHVLLYIINQYKHTHSCIKK